MFKKSIDAAYPYSSTVVYRRSHFRKKMAVLEQAMTWMGGSN
jgi:hypothetical protein